MILSVACPTQSWCEEAVSVDELCLQATRSPNLTQAQAEGADLHGLQRDVRAVGG